MTWSGAMTSYQITPADNGVTIEVTGVGESQRQLLEAFGECQAGQCSCPTTEYEKVEAMQVEATGDAIAVRLQAKPGTEFDRRQIAACLDYTVDKAGQ
jgi:hypothetical protein